mmetsp:Transcript_40505/g.65691  ORF Transcript_40505/g.65691 Transcript_40505/m.65691 type:complete len:618 (+) Transcript_40505:49-1902(+)|eukprot:CAMPEP_0184333398 /NCGR_PEP_ID=MMETSP1089-20130417/2395_1 /TAXON_ID=38269 ORGANISM="Gloeochaete wittrockiana, Strain SAG46.84" /NCGR_SAMPLE_ID=MMETSP1089 /ASSEMBLY_ACC=CAM_ASM_000445 /LENGTH=617 /DNA_ID=CAMNT_0026657199 /DNA_START=45 /DNA_END=1898 /DNA_ORIENTATION=-
MAATTLNVPLIPAIYPFPYPAIGSENLPLLSSLWQQHDAPGAAADLAGISEELHVICNEAAARSKFFGKMSVGLETWYKQIKSILPESTATEHQTSLEADPTLQRRIQNRPGESKTQPVVKEEPLDTFNGFDGQGIVNGAAEALKRKRGANTVPLTSGKVPQQDRKVSHGKVPSTSKGSSQPQADALRVAFADPAVKKNKRKKKRRREDDSDGSESESQSDGEGDDTPLALAPNAPSALPVPPVSKVATSSSSVNTAAPPASGSSHPPTSTNPFWAHASSFLMPITRNDMEDLQRRIGETAELGEMWMSIPPLGRYYTLQWAEEDCQDGALPEVVNAPAGVLAANMQNFGRGGVSTRMRGSDSVVTGSSAGGMTGSTAITRPGSTLPGDVDGGDSEVGPNGDLSASQPSAQPETLTQRLMQALLEDDAGLPLLTDRQSDMASSCDDGELDHHADLDMLESGMDGEVYCPLCQTEATECLEERIRLQLVAAGLFDEGDKFPLAGDGAREDDDICIEIRSLQEKLQVFVEQNMSRLRAIKQQLLPHLESEVRLVESIKSDETLEKMYLKLNAKNQKHHGANDLHIKKRLEVHAKTFADRVRDVYMEPSTIERPSNDEAE